MAALTVLFPLAYMVFTVVPVPVAGRSASGRNDVTGIAAPVEPGAGPGGFGDHRRAPGPVGNRQLVAGTEVLRPGQGWKAGCEGRCPTGHRHRIAAALGQRDRHTGLGEAAQCRLPFGATDQRN